MDAETFDGHLGTSVTIDLCLPCQVFWFDTRESLKFSPGSVLKLFRIIGEHALAARARTTTPPRVPPLQHTSAPDPRSAAQHAFPVPALPARSRATHHVGRFFAREGLHPAPVGSTDRGAAPERSGGQLLELRSPNRSHEELIVRALRFTAVDAGHEAGRRARRRAPRIGTADAADRSNTAAAARTRAPRC